MRRQYRVKSVVPTLILYGVTALLTALNWYLVSKEIALPYFSIIFFAFGKEVPIWVRILLDSLPLIVNTAIFAFVPHRKNPFLPLIVFFAFGIFQQTASLASNVASSPALVYLAIFAASVLLFTLPCLLNSALWRRKWVYVVAACGLLLTNLLIVPNFLLARAGSIIPEVRRLEIFRFIVDLAATVVVTLAWLLYCLLIRPVGEKQQTPAPASWPQSPAQPTGWTPPAPSAPGFRAPEAAPRIPVSQIPQSGSGIPASQTPSAPGASAYRERTACVYCGADIPAVSKFCPNCGRTVPKP